MEWWLLERDIRRQSVRVRRVLERLVAEGLVVGKQGAAGRMHYAIKPVKLHEIRERPGTK